MPELSVVVPTISGREESLEITLRSYEETLAGDDYEIIIIQDAPTWPEGCNEGHSKVDAEYYLFGADDLDALPGWWEAGRAALEERPLELPAPRVYDIPEGWAEPNWRLLSEKDGADGELTHFTRVPLMSRAQWETVGPWPPLIYYADMWVSEKARTLGIRTRMVYGFDFFHRWSQIGRVDSKENLDESGWYLNRLREEMV
jgi:hypothetical protein